jgi:hypothetical protein
MTLLDRLKPEFIVKIDSIEQQYPSTYKCIIKSLKDNDYYTDLRVGDALSLLAHLDLDISNLTSIFIS